MSHDFYVVLGVSRDADLDQIKRAYRKLVKRYHPDTSESQPEKFLQLQQAYETLRDEHSRREHDQTTGRPVEVQVRRGPVARGRGTRSTPPPGRELSSLVDEFFDGWIPGLFTGGRRARHKDLYVELILDPAEAAGGGLFPLQVPAETSCPACDGRGTRDGLACPDCRGRGRTVSYHPIQVSIPPGVADGTSRRLALDDIGLPGVDLIVLVTVNA